MHVLAKGITGISRALGNIAIGLIAASILIVCQMVILRYGFNASTTWQTDFVTYSLVGATIIGSPILLHRGAHVRVDLFTQKFGSNVQRWLAVFANLVVVVLGVIFAVTGYELTLDAFNGNWLSDTIAEYPLWIPYSSLPLGFGLLALQALADTLFIFTNNQEQGHKRGMSKVDGESNP